MNVDLQPCCKPRLLEQESWGTARNSMDMLEKVLEDSAKLKITMEKQWNEDDEKKRTSEDVSKKRREGEKT